MPAARHVSSPPTSPTPTTYAGSPPRRATSTSWSTTRASTEFAPTFETDDADFDDQINTNLRAPYILVQKLVPGMIERGRGSVVNVTHRRRDHTGRRRGHLRRQQGGAGAADQGVGRRVRRRRACGSTPSLRTDETRGTADMAETHRGAGPDDGAGIAPPKPTEIAQRGDVRRLAGRELRQRCDVDGRRRRSGDQARRLSGEHRVERGVEQAEPVVGRTGQRPRWRARDAASARRRGRWPS